MRLEPVDVDFLRSRAKRLLFLGRINAAETDAVLDPVGVEQCDRVAIGNGHYAALDDSAMTGHGEQQGQAEEGFHSGILPADSIVPDVVTA